MYFIVVTPFVKVFRKSVIFKHTNSIVFFCSSAFARGRLLYLGFTLDYPSQFLFQYIVYVDPDYVFSVDTDTGMVSQSSNGRV